jgi:hypothetical protein
MLQRIATIAFHTYREAVRARILFGLGALALGTTLYSIAVGAFSLKAGPRVISDMGGASISLYAIVVAIVVGGTSLYRELEQKTIFPILARPIRRGEYLVGKYLGTVLVLFVFIAFDAAAVLLVVATLAGRSPFLTVGLGVATAALLGLLAWKSPRLGTTLPAPIALLLAVVAAWLASPAQDEQRVVVGMSILALLEVGIVAAIATLFASFSSPFLSAIFTFGLFLVGRSADTLAKLPVRTFGPGVKSAGLMLSKVVPNLQVYVPPRPLLTGESSTLSFGAHLGLATLQTVFWATLLLALSSVIFKRRDFL